MYLIKPLQQMCFLKYYNSVNEQLKRRLRKGRRISKGQKLREKHRGKRQPRKERQKQEGEESDIQK